MYKTVYDLDDEELLELKYAYYDQLQYTDDADTFRMPEEIPDSVVLDHYVGILFTNDDFFCNCAEGYSASYFGV